VPLSLSFNIEVKYPYDKGEAESQGIPMADVNHFIDKILETVFNFAGERNIIFSSFSPEVCLALNFKQPNYPVFFLTEAGMSQCTDHRCNSLQEAIRFAQSGNLFGIVSHCDPLIDAPVIIPKIKESGFILLTYGVSNNDIANVQLQQKCGVDAVIVDHVAHVRKGLVSLS
jgi:glycerophosphodiester phosphodiesterase